jgi:hypothetical protein
LRLFHNALTEAGERAIAESTTLPVAVTDLARSHLSRGV